MKYLLYGHGGAYNHGAEAIVRMTVSFLRQCKKGKIFLSTHFPEQDRKFGLDILVDELISADLSLAPDEKNANGTENKKKIAYQIYREALSVIDNDTVCIAIGGDNYCYSNWYRQTVFHEVAKSRGARSILWCCSIQPEMIDDAMLRELKEHDRIYTRESSTYNALCNHKLTNLTLLPDPAFILPVEKISMPKGFQRGDTVAVNLSPLILRKSPQLMNAYADSVHWLLQNVSAVLMVPHVLMPADNDMEALQCLAEHLPEEDQCRLCWASEKLNVMQIKYLISQCELVLCSRTHVSIAAYSSAVPVTVVGYSIKSVGIGNDMGMSDYVVPSEQTGLLLETVKNTWENRAQIKKHLLRISSEQKKKCRNFENLCNEGMYM